MPRGRPVVALLAGCLLASGCTSGRNDDPDGGPSGGPNAVATLSPETTQPAGATTVVQGATPAELALATSRALFTSSPVVVAAPVDDLATQALAAAAAVRLGVPLLLVPAPSGPPQAPSAPGTPAASGAPSTPPAEPADAAALRSELGRLGATTVLAVGLGRTLGGLGDAKVVVAPTDAPGLFALVDARPGIPRSVAPEALVSAVAGLDPNSPAALTVVGAPPPAAAPGSDATSTTAPQLLAVRPAAPLPGLVVLAPTDPTAIAAVATARAAGTTVLATPGNDPRVSPDVITALAAAKPTAVLALGAVFGTAESLAYRVSVAETGVQLPGGGQVVFPGRRMVALYGYPSDGALGVLGEQGLDASIARAKETAAQYDGLFGADPVIPAFEIIATVASAFAGPDGNYSTESKIDDPEATNGEDLRAYVAAARAAGVYVMLDLQPGRSDFLTQAKLYESLLLEPNVGLALDPEWRLTPTQKPLEVIGTVSAAEINTVVTWLADLTRDNKLPQKIFMLHQFKLSMIQNRDQVDTSRDELSYLIHADGNGPPAAKYATFAAINASPPPNVRWGWKNFYDEDSPTLTPAQTAAVRPQPVFVSYQ